MKRFKTRTAPLFIVILGLFAAGTIVTVNAWAQQSATPNTSRAYLHSYNLPSSGVALEGYCPVSYFAVNKAVMGKPEYASTYQGVTYHFAVPEGKTAFDRNPEKYLPAYGGWCAFGMAIEDKFPVDPTAFKIVNGRLMLFLRNQNLDARELWNSYDQNTQVNKADAHWKNVSG
ncbi:YHS domain-containing (seleno)protein [Mucisphaera calidilacus]|uniref:YHS domain protein n=1 Tax=Mucisphaera calidilacus TaxID=2527982 RepID=A0A518C017_9BACT|nr:YHS domain-containing (seleno)protein [Mucisphaera calidilacus]QDU72549.1 YHS domain protein [Mucisphaera calidilacus]